jgi:hypothetical protein
VAKPKLRALCHPEKWRHVTASGECSTCYARRLRRDSPPFRQAQIEVNRRARFQKLYKMTVADYDAMLRDQGGACAICRRPETAKQIGRTQFLSVDHDHETGAVRGLLCAHCNKALGHFRDSPGLLRYAAEYLETAFRANLKLAA